MTYLALKAAISGLLVVLVSEVARRSPGIGGIIASLPLISVLAFIWLWRDTADVERIAIQAETTFWFLLPTLPMFLLLPAMLRAGAGFWLSLTICCAATMALYVATLWLLARFGVNI